MFIRLCHQSQPIGMMYVTLSALLMLFSMPAVTWAQFPDVSQFNVNCTTLEFIDLYTSCLTDFDSSYAIVNCQVNCSLIDDIALCINDRASFSRQCVSSLADAMRQLPEALRDLLFQDADLTSCPNLVVANVLGVCPDLVSLIWADWSRWSAYGPCSTSCQQTRSRQCQNVISFRPPEAAQGCQGPASESQACSPCGATTTEQPDEVASIDSLDPTFGPVSGGTNVTLKGQNLDGFMLLQLGSLTPDVTFQSGERISFRTPNVSDDLADAKLNVTMVTKRERLIVGPVPFEYRPDPVFEDISPRDTISRGGTLLTITGFSLNSVAYPILNVILVNRTQSGSATRKKRQAAETQTIFQAPCPKISENNMVCTVPDLDVPQKPYQAEEDGRVNSGDLTFYLGFELDGLDLYRNISDVPGLEDLGTLDVYTSPSFDEAEDVIYFNKGTSLQLRGTNLRRGIRLSDYSVTIGSGRCEVTDLSDTVLTCRPPDTEPTTGSSQSGTYSIIIKLGANLEHDYGVFAYSPQGLSMIMIIIIGVAAGVVLLVILITVIACCCRKSENERIRAKRQQAAAPYTTNINLPPIQTQDFK